MEKIISFFIKLPLLAVGLYGLFIGLLTLTYSSLTQEKLVATIIFEKVPKKTKIFTAHLYNNKGFKINDYTIYGDQWQLDANFVKMKYFADIFGAESKYALNRFEGRYSNIQEANRNPHVAYQIENSILIQSMSFLVDTSYGSSVYKRIYPNIQYNVFKTATGLMVRTVRLKQ